MPSLFVAARDSRHRAACFALYKALIKQGVRVPLPHDVLKAPGLEGPVHPIKHLIRKSFRRNRNDTSPRLVISALRNGYKFLDMLSAAQDKSTPEYENIYDFIRDRQRRKSMALSLRALKDPPPAKPHSAPNPNTIPLLTRVSEPGEVPRYEATVRPRPLSELGGSGRRHVPVLENANYVPMMRLTKPQPAIMSRIILSKLKRMDKVVKGLQKAGEETQEDAIWEDQWETILRTGRPIDPATLATRRDGHQEPRRSGPYESGVKQDIYDLRGRLLQIRLDDHARGSALAKLVQDERAMAEKEMVDRKQKRRKEREAQKAAGNSSARSAQDITAALRGDLS